MALIVSANSNVATVTVTNQQWFLIDPVTSTNNLPLAAASFSASFSKRTGVFQAIGQKEYIVLTDTIAGKAGTAVFKVWNMTDFAALRAQLSAAKTFLLQSPYGGDQTYIQFVNKVGHSLDIPVSTVAAQQTFSLDFVEVKPPPVTILTPTVPITAATPPSIPTGVSAVAGNQSATVTWAQASDGGRTITAYTVTPYINGVAQASFPVTGAPAAQIATVPGLTNGFGYSFTVTATNIIGSSTASLPSNTVTPTALGLFVGSSTAATGTAGAAALSLQLINGIQPGDTIFIVSAHTGPDPVASPAGYADIGGSAVGQSLTPDIFVRVADGTESLAQVTLTVPAVPAYALSGAVVGPSAPPVANPGSGNRAQAANGGHVDNNVYSNPRNSTAAAFAAGEAFTGVNYHWGMIESTPDPSIAQAVVGGLTSDPGGNFRDGRAVPAWVFSLYGTFNGATTAQVAAGAVDANLINICNSINSIKWPKIAIRPGWEVDGGWFSWGANPTDFINMFIHVRAVMNAHLTVPVLWEWNAFALRGSPNATNPLGHKTLEYYPGDQYVDIIGCDSYEVQIDSSDTALLPTMQQAAMFAASHGKQVAYSEWGFWDAYNGAAPTMEASGRTVRTMNAVLAFFDSLPAAGQPGSLAYQLYFDGNPGTGQFAWVFFPKALAVYKARMLQP